MDAFFASIEQAINPKLKGKPLIVGSRGSKFHTVVCAASYEAKAYGIHSGMPSKEAFQICPNLEFVPAEQGKYIWTSEQIFAMLKEYGFEVVYASIDEFRLDIPESIDHQALAETIRKQIQKTFNITASVGIAQNCLLAKLASKINKPNGIAIISENNLEEILGKTPVEKFCGIGEASTETLHNLDIKTCLDLYQKPVDFLKQAFGKNGINFYLSLHSIDTLNIQEEESNPKSVGHSYTLTRATQNPVFIKAWIRLLSEMVANRLRKNNLAANTVHLWLNGPEIGHLGLQKTFQQAVSDGFEIYQRSLKIMAKAGLKSPKIRALGVTCSSLSAADYSPLFREQKRREDLIKAVDKINARQGEGSIYPAIINLTKETA